MNCVYSVIAMLCAMVLSPSIRAKAVALSLNPAQTQITYTLGAVLHTVDGTFKLKNGVIQFDSVTGRASGEIVVDATSGESGNSNRDQKMHKSVLESPRYPEIIFIPERVEGHVSLSGESQVQLQGLLKLHGSQHEITLPADIQVSGNQLTAAVHFAIPYVQWGLKDPSTFILRVDKTVDITIHAAGSLSRPSAAH
ncbi:MAG TPA: YceI family protein [Candidatus Acidoferrales bacterium]|nr:YceI family protein [Candidatus Acidoferrales bacterium]